MSMTGSPGWDSGYATSGRAFLVSLSPFTLASWVIFFVFQAKVAHTTLTVSPEFLCIGIDSSDDQT